MSNMPVSNTQKKSRDKWDAEHMAYQTVKLRRELLDEFKQTCADRGDKVNTVLVDAIRAYIAEKKA